MSFKINWDALGITTSIVCAIHCAVLPLVLTSMPLFGINIIHNPVFEYVMIVCAFSIGCYALIHGYRKYHRNLSPFMIFLAGMILLLAKQALHSIQLWLLIPAVLFIVSAHYLNFRLGKSFRHC